ncbi:MAG: hypothetical protein J0L93_03530 [Deltaproteobacteria bacterium]|nr:hypothetical protein [Deltaproteobacteria bacterium]
MRRQISKIKNLLTIGGVFLLSVSVYAASEPIDNESEFGYYFNEFISHELDTTEPMAKLIVNRLAETIFDTTSKSEFEGRLRMLRSSLKAKPELLDRYMSLDARLRNEFDERIEKAKEKRMLYTVSGAVIGAVVGIPVGKVLSTSTSMGMKVMAITIPAGALTGAGAGFLLGQLIEMPHYDLQEGALMGDLDLMNKELQEVK